jgi:hypothetical protein
MGRRYYVDTSAYLCLLLGQPGHEVIARELRDQDLLSSTLLLVEAERNLVRHARAGALEAQALHRALTRLQADAQAFTLRDLTPDLCLNRVMPMISTPRTLDLVHLRTATWFHDREPLDRFVSLDAAQVQSAQELGLPT